MTQARVDELSSAFSDKLEEHTELRGANGKGCDGIAKAEHKMMIKSCECLIRQTSESMTNNACSNLRITKTNYDVKVEKISKTKAPMRRKSV